MQAADVHAIDVHHHYVPPAYLKELSAPLPPLKSWSPAHDLEDLDRAGTRTAILSVTTPGFWFGDVAQTRRLARLSKDYAARMVADHPGPIGCLRPCRCPTSTGR